MTSNICLVVTIVSNIEGGLLSAIKGQAQLPLQDIANFLEPHDYVVKFSATAQVKYQSYHIDSFLLQLILS